ncbi:hypothetical protein H4219_006481, partial [Mycoemilia scoparia]
CPAFVLPELTVALPASMDDRIPTVIEHIALTLDLFDERDCSFQQVERRVMKHVFGMKRYPNSVGIVMSSLSNTEHLLQSVLTVQDTDYPWSSTNGPIFPLILKDLPLAIGEHRISAALRLHGKVSHLKKALTTTGTWFGHWTALFQPKSAEVAVPKELHFHGIKGTFGILQTLDHSFCRYCGSVSALSNDCSCPTPVETTELPVQPVDNDIPTPAAPMETPQDKNEVLVPVEGDTMCVSDSEGSSPPSPTLSAAPTTLPGLSITPTTDSTLPLSAILPAAPIVGGLALKTTPSVSGVTR